MHFFAQPLISTMLGLNGFVPNAAKSNLPLATKNTSPSSVKNVAPRSPLPRAKKANLTMFH